MGKPTKAPDPPIDMGLSSSTQLHHVIAPILLLHIIAQLANVYPNHELPDQTTLGAKIRISLVDTDASVLETKLAEDVLTTKLLVAMQFAYTMIYVREKEFLEPKKSPEKFPMYETLNFEVVEDSTTDASVQKSSRLVFC